MNKDERIKLYLALAAPFPSEAVERTSGSVTGRGYDTTGIKYQYLADRLNEVTGVGGFRTIRTITVRGITTAKGRPAHEAIAEVSLELGEWLDGTFVPFAQAWGDGGHIAMSEADARKGAFTNGFKKAAAFLGAGRDAYRGTLDDDHTPANDVDVAEIEVPTQGVAADRSIVPVSPAQPIRNRLSSKQFGALRSLSRSTGFTDVGFKEFVRKRFGAESAYLSRAQASELIGELMAKVDRRTPEAA